MVKGARFSDCRKYRYVLWRTWRENRKRVMFIGLNPSIADETADDPTIRRCIGFAEAWGFGGIYMLNLFAFRATNPKEMKKTSDPIGPLNNDFLKIHIKPSGLNIACWGTHGNFMNRSKTVIELLGDENLSCFGMTQSGQPKHPLYLKRGLEPISLLQAGRLN